MKLGSLCAFALTRRTENTHTIYDCFPESAGGTVIGLLGNDKGGDLVELR